MVRAMTKGFMPSTEQVIINLRTLLASDILNPDDSSVSDSGRLLAKHTKTWLQQFIDALQTKNGRDYIQDFIWFLAKSRVSIDVADLANKASTAKARADSYAAYQSLRTLGSLILINSDFRVFLTDLQTVGRQVFQESAASLSSAAEDAGNRIAPTDAKKDALATGSSSEAPTRQDLNQDVKQISDVIADEATTVTKETRDSVQEHLTGPEGETLMNRLKSAILNLRKRTDYKDSVSTVTLLLKRYAMVYSRAIENTVSTTQADVQTNPEVDHAFSNFMSFVMSFGDEAVWKELEDRFKIVIGHQQRHPEFESVMNETGDAIQKLLMDPEALSNADGKFKELRQKYEQVGDESSLRQDMGKFLDQTQIVLRSVTQDEDVSRLFNTTMKIFNILSPAQSATNTDLLQDSVNVFLPLLIQAVQYIPIPRLEISVPEIDLLLENLILEPGVTVNNTSFLPFRLRVETQNDVEIRKARMRTFSKMTSLTTIKLDGLSVRAEEIGFWMKAHSGIFRLADSGIASFELDHRGMDIHIDVEIGQERLEKILSLKAVRVHIHHLSYNLRKSKFAFIAWLLKPLMRPIIRKVMEKQIATAIAEFFHSANRELLYARERLRATRISDPQDLRTFVKAIMTRLTPEDDPDVYTRVGVAQPGEGVFKGVYAPGSVVKLWNEEAARAPEVIDDFDQGGWRNDVFDVTTSVPT